MQVRGVWVLITWVAAPLEQFIGELAYWVCRLAAGLRIATTKSWPLMAALLRTCSSTPSGGCQDYRPSSNATTPQATAASSATSNAPATSADAQANEGWWPAGLDCASGTTAPIWLSGAERVELTDVNVERKVRGGLAGHKWQAAGWW